MKHLASRITRTPQAGRQLRRARLLALFLLLALALPSPSPVAGPKPLALRHVALDLPGPPADILHADLDGDGRQDLAVVVARTQWGEIGNDRIEGMIQISEVVPALFDRREVRAYRQGADGTYTLAGEPLALKPSVISLEAGPPGLPIAVLTEEGVSALSLIMDSPETSEGGDGAAARADVNGNLGGVVSGGSTSAPAASGSFLTLTPWITDRPVLAGSKSLIPRLDMVRDLDGDGTWDLLLPARDGLAVYVAAGGDLATSAASRLALPGDERRSGVHPSRRFPRPAVGDLDADGKPDLLFIHTDKGRSGKTAVEVLRGEGGGRFGAPQRVAIDRFVDDSKTVVTDGRKGSKKDNDHFGDNDDEAGFKYFGDLTGDGLAEAVFVAEIDNGKSGLKQVKEPEFEYRFYHADKNLAIQPQPYQKLRVQGFGFSIDEGEVQAEEFLDLDGDSRKDLVTVTLDFSLFQLVHVMATKRISIGLNFHVWHQGSDGVFAPVTGLDLSETLRMDLNNLKLGSLAEFAGDFDGDGRSDFVHLGRGKQVTIHRGQAGCRYAPKADLTVPFEEEPGDVSLVRIGDYDGDGRADIGLIRPIEVKDSPDPDVSSPVRLDLYLSGGAR
jgi:hypothetical protein